MSDSVFRGVFPLGEDATPYRKLQPCPRLMPVMVV